MVAIGRVRPAPLFTALYLEIHEVFWLKKCQSDSRGNGPPNYRFNRDLDTGQRPVLKGVLGFTIAKAHRMNIE